MNQFGKSSVTGRITAGFGILVSTLVVLAACVERPGPRCIYDDCSNGNCYKICTVDPLDGFGECQDYGGSEDECTYHFVVDLNIWKYPGTCVNNVCQYSARFLDPYTGYISSDTSPCE